MRFAIERPSGRGSSWAYDPETSGLIVTQEVDVGLAAMFQVGTHLGEGVRNKKGEAKNITHTGWAEG